MHVRRSCAGRVGFPHECRPLVAGRCQFAKVMAHPLYGSAHPHRAQQHSQEDVTIPFPSRLLTQKNMGIISSVRGKATAYVDTVRFNNPVGITLGEIQEDPVAYEDKKLRKGVIFVVGWLIFRFLLKSVCIHRDHGQACVQVFRQDRRSSE